MEGGHGQDFLQLRDQTRWSKCNCESDLTFLRAVPATSSALAKLEHGHLTRVENGAKKQAKN
eukprot:1310109-Pleurochrysis_carterae.AAC.1